MYLPAYTKQFKKDLKRLRSRGTDLALLKEVLQKLIKGESISNKYRNHKLVGNYKGRRECHIQADWLLIYKIDSDKIIFERTGSHSDLFY